MNFEFRASCGRSFWKQTRFLMNKNYEKINGPNGQLGNANEIIGMVLDIIDRPRSDAVDCRLFLTIVRRRMWQKWRNVEL